MTKKELPAVKKGDKIILLASINNPNNRFIGKVLEVTTNRIKPPKTSFNAEAVGDPTKGYITVYYDGPGDEFVLATGEAMLKFLRGKRESLQVEMNEVDKEIEFRTKYKNEEEYVADKLDHLITTSIGKGAKEDRVKAMALILKELKSSNLL